MEWGVRARRSGSVGAAEWGVRARRSGSVGTTEWGALDGVRVLVLTSEMGWYAGKLLADLDFY